MLVPRVVDAYTISPGEIRQGDIMVFVVKAIVVRDGVYRLYRCQFDGDDVPQGARVYVDEAAVCRALFPTLANVAEADK